MAFADLFSAPAKTAAPTSNSWGGLFGSVSPDKVAQQGKIDTLTKASDAAKAKSQQANSVVGILKNTIAGLPEASGIPQMYNQGQQDKTTAAESFFKDKGVVAKAGDLYDATFGAAEQIGSVFAPALNTLHVSDMIRAAGDSIGNSSSSLPAFALSPAGQVTAKIADIIQKGSIIAGTVLGGLDTFRSGVRLLSPKPEVPVEAPVVPREEPVVAPKPVESAPAAAEPVQAPAKPVTEAVTAPKAPVAATEEPAPAMVDARASKAASDISAHLVDAGFKELPIEEQATYTPSTKAYQLDRVAKIMSDIPKAIEMALNKREIPGDVHPNLVFNSVAKYADQTKNFDLQRELAKSPLADLSSKHGQGLGAESFIDMNHSTVKIIRAIQKIRDRVKAPRLTKERAVGKRRVAVEKRKVEVRNMVSNFIASIEC